MKTVTTTLTLCALLGGAAIAAPPLSPAEHDKKDIAKSFSKGGYSPYAGRNFATSVYWGDTHLHTAASGDAFGFGNKLDDVEALRFARGEEITSAGGLRVKLSRPLDFLVVADHAEAFGAMIEVFYGNPALMGNPKSKRWAAMLKEGGETSFKAVMEMIESVSDKSCPPEMLDKKLFKPVWEKHTANVDKYNKPGTFSAFQGFEWTCHPGGNNQHRVVIFRDAADKVNQIFPFSAFDTIKKGWLRLK